jgi:hypothetical protein
LQLCWYAFHLPRDINCQTCDAPIVFTPGCNMDPKGLLTQFVCNTPESIQQANQSVSNGSKSGTGVSPSATGTISKSLDRQTTISWNMALICIIVLGLTF